MKSRLTVLCVFALSAGICQSGMSQILAPAPPPLDGPGTTFILPSPLPEQTLASPNGTFILPAPLPTLQTLPMLQRGTSDGKAFDQARQGFNVSRQQAQEALKRLPPVMEQIPVPPIRPNAIAPPFAAQSRVAQLVRGDEVLEISNESLRNSGLFQKAISSSPALSQSYQLFEARTLQLQQLQWQVANEMRNSKPRMDELKQSIAATEGQLPNAASLALIKERDELQATAAARQTVLNNTMAAQMQTRAAFENDLWRIGLNGAKVASVRSESTRDRTGTGDYVVVEAVASSLSNNLGYTRTRVRKNGDMGATTVPSEYLLPLPVDSNDPFHNMVTPYGKQRAPDGLMVRAFGDDTQKNPVVQFFALPRVAAYYDTGFLSEEGNNFAESVSLLSDRDPKAGQHTFSFLPADAKVPDTLPVDLALNTQVMDLGGGQAAQVFAVANNHFDAQQFDIHHYGVRVYNRRLGSLFEGWSLAAGTQQSLFGETVLRPMALDGRGTLVGTVELVETRPQIALHVPLSNHLTWKMAMEDSYLADIEFATDTQELRRVPTFTTNLTWKDSRSRCQLHLGGIARSFGFQETGNQIEHFDTGWGLSAIAKFTHNRSANVFGIAGGEGVGNYIQGVSRAAVADATSIHAISGLGIFAGRQTVWLDHHNKQVAAFNLAYGYALMDDPAGLGGMQNEELHHGRVNYMRFLGDQVGVGVEYQFGYRQQGSGDAGEDHRMMLVVSVKSSKQESSTQARTNARALAVTGAGGWDADLGPPQQIRDEYFTPSAGAATISGRPIGDVVQQYQLGGAAYQQSL